MAKFRGKRQPIRLQDRQGFTEKKKTVKIIRIERAKIVKLSSQIIEQRALALRKLEMEYQRRKDEILRQEWEVRDDKIRKVK